MKTQIFNSYTDFLNREDRDINGVSPQFVERNPNWGKQNETNKGCYDCSDCSRCYGCSDCSDCYDCSRCYDCYDCYDCSEKNEEITIPKIKNIHQKVFAAASQKGALEMGNWHTCETTHCRAGWVVHLAGEEGKNLEKKTSTLFAAMQIYKESSPIKVSPVRFYDGNEAALNDMEKCAELEAKP